MDTPELNYCSGNCLVKNVVTSLCMCGDTLSCSSNAYNLEQLEGSIMNTAAKSEPLNANV